MIIISLGNPGSGKTASIVREMIINKTKRTTYSNIVPKKELDFIKVIDPSMIVTKELSERKVLKSGEVREKFKPVLNVEYWKNINEPINVVIDEAHSIVNSRRSMSKMNVIVTDWLALIRRVLGSSDSGHGQLVLISQLHNRIDVIAREMATQIRYHVCHYMKTCTKCQWSWSETSEYPEPAHICMRCGSTKVNKHSHKIEVWCFSNMDRYMDWRELQQTTYYKHYFIEDIETYFPYYDTLQWDNMFSDVEV